MTYRNTAKGKQITAIGPLEYAQHFGEDWIMYFLRYARGQTHQHAHTQRQTERQTYMLITVLRSLTEAY